MRDKCQRQPKPEQNPPCRAVLSLQLPTTTSTGSTHMVITGACAAACLPPGRPLMGVPRLVRAVLAALQPDRPQLRDRRQHVRGRWLDRELPDAHLVRRPCLHGRPGCRSSWPTGSCPFPTGSSRPLPSASSRAPHHGTHSKSLKASHWQSDPKRRHNRPWGSPPELFEAACCAWSGGVSGRTTGLLARGGSVPISQCVLTGEFLLVGPR
jgi:hypothetical protein